jgi:general secretion pathway protein G
MDPRTRRRAPSRGFTLTEMMVVIVILGLLATLVVPNVLHKYEEAARAAARAELATLLNTLNEVAIRNGGRFPGSLEDLVTPDEGGHTYLDARTVPVDPWGNAYVYEPPAPGEPRPRVLSWGPDRQAGTGDDIDSWNLRAR